MSQVVVNSNHELFKIVSKIRYSLSCTHSKTFTCQVLLLNYIQTWDLGFWQSLFAVQKTVPFLKVRQITEQRSNRWNNISKERTCVITLIAFTNNEAKNYRHLARFRPHRSCLYKFLTAFNGKKVSKQSEEGGSLYLAISTTPAHIFLYRLRLRSYAKRRTYLQNSHV